MAYLRIHCDYCGQTWEVYERSMHDEHSRECPHCHSKIEDRTWTGEVLPALGQAMDANRELLKDHLGYHTPVFSFDVLADVKYQNNKTIEDLDELREEIAEVKEGIDNLSEVVATIFQF